MANKEKTNYKSSFSYETTEGNVVNIGIDLNFDGVKPVLNLEVSEKMPFEDYSTVLISTSKSILYKMDFDIMKNADILITAAGENIGISAIGIIGEN